MTTRTDGAADLLAPQTDRTDGQPPEPAPIVPRRRLLLDLMLGAAAATGAVLFGRQPDSARAGTDGDWTLTGNTVADETRFLGTRNAHRLTMKTNSIPRVTVLADGRVGVGTTRPAHRLHVAGAGTAVIRAESTSALATASGVLGTAPGIGVTGKSTGAAGTGIRGEAPNSISTALSAAGVRGAGTVGILGSGEYMGVQGSSPNYAVFGYTDPDTAGIGVYGRGGLGVKGRSYTGSAVLGDTDSGTGVKGESYASGGAVKAIWGVGFGDANNGVVGEANNGASAYGVWGRSSSGYAGVFSGKALVTGTLSKGGGSFRIDHPLEPERKYLSHSFVESPDMMNVYNGNVTTDARGRITVTLPAYFESLNRDFRYQLTTIGRAAHAWISREISSGAFSIETDQPNTKVSWQVTGIRKDPFANANRIVVEEDKPANERGTYLHPQAYGKPDRLAFDHSRRASLEQRPSARGADPRP